MNLDHIFSHWKIIREDLFITIDLFDESELDFVPFDGGWSVRQILLHIANAEDGWFRYALKNEVAAWPENPKSEDYPDSASLKDLLTGIHTKTVEYLDKTPFDEIDRKVTLPWGPVVPLSWIFWHILEHEIHHRGELSLILGLLGKEGPDV